VREEEMLLRLGSTILGAIPSGTANATNTVITEGLTEREAY